jgi:hypothetical protein
MREGYEPARPYPVVRHDGARAPYAPVAPPSPAALAADVARFFHDLRGALRLTPMQAAQALATRVDILAALESGQVDALPPWPETCRIVRTYASFAGLDPRPVLHILEQLSVAAPRAPVPPRAARRPILPNIGSQGAPILKAINGGGRRAADAARNVRRAVNDHAGRPGMALFAVTLSVAVVVLMTQTTVLEAAVAQLPPSMKRFVRGAQNYVIVRFAPVRDGLRWIDVPDPRTRRGDKLQTAVR